MMFKFSKPETWNYMPLYEKIAYYSKMLTRDYAPYVDKLEAKHIVKELCGDTIQVAPVKRILSGPDDFTEADIDPLCMIKSSHGSGWNINMTTDTKVDEVKELLNKWNCVYRESETQYKYIQPRFFIEEKVDDAVLGITDKAITYMFRCIHGVPVTIGIRQGAVQHSYDMNWKQLAIDHKQPDSPISKPENINEMIMLAKRLSKPFEFVRIDFYLGKDGIYLSEYTFTPSAGFRLYSMKVEKELGKLWR